MAERPVELLKRSISSEDDQEAQLNELLAVQSILGPESFIIEEGSELNTVRVLISVDLHARFRISDGGHTKSKLEGVDPDRLDVETGEPIEAEGVPVQYLPPLTLFFSLPNDYPSKSKPIFTLVSSWMDRASLSILCRQLDTLWLQNEGTEVIYLWTSFLQTESMALLDSFTMYDVSKCSISSASIVPLGPRTPFQIASILSVSKESVSNGVSTSEGVNAASDRELRSTSRGLQSREELPCTSKSLQARKVLVSQSDDLRIPNMMTRSKYKALQLAKAAALMDSRAVFDPSVNPGDKQALVEWLMQFNEDEFIRQFVAKTHRCDVCFSEKGGSEFSMFPCRDFFCKDCVKQYFTTHIIEGAVGKIKCLGPKCRQTPSLSMIRELVGVELSERYEKFTLQLALDQMGDLCYCPRSQCGKPVISEANDKLGSCPYCNFKFCTLCRSVYHGVDSCKFKTGEKERLFKKYTEGTEEEKKGLEMAYGKRELQTLVSTTLSEEWIKDKSKPCPHCKAPIEKFEGCNKVHCSKCDAFFCWDCLVQLDKTSPYAHFNNPASTCYNKLFGGVNENAFDEEEWIAGNHEIDMLRPPNEELMDLGEWDYHRIFQFPGVADNQDILEDHELIELLMAIQDPIARDGARRAYNMMFNRNFELE